ncbi:MAG: cysteine synthase CysM [Spirochaetota bacterium]
MKYKTIEDMIGNTPLVRLQRQDTGTSTVLAKLEGNNPAGSVKDRPAYGMIAEAERRGDISPGDTLIEATSGNTGIALAMVAAIRGYHMVLIMPESASEERKALMAAYGAKLIPTPKDRGMEGAIDTARELENDGTGRILNQFGNADNPEAHYRGTGPEIWRDTEGAVTHFVASMGTTGTIMGTGRYLKERNPDIQIVGVQPGEGAKIPGSRAWPQEYQPAIYEPQRIDRIMRVTQQQAEETARRLAREEGIFAGISSGGSVFSAVSLAKELDNALVVAIVCDRGDRYLSTGVFPTS